MRTYYAFPALIGVALIIGHAAAVFAADPAQVKAGVAALSPQNTRIQFICAHVGPKPDPRTGHFAKFSGKAQVDAAANSLQSVSVDIETASLTTEIDKLTAHLKSPDFFEVRQYPTAKFESTKVTPGQGQSQITGKLTMHGVTKEISFPATVSITPSGLSLHSEFNINRSDFGMKFGPDRVEDKVALTITIGNKK